jgi:hypothetical protein
MPKISILLTASAPKTLDTDEWPILLQTPESNAAAQLLVIRVNGTRAVVYGHTGAGTGVSGAGIFAGQAVGIEGSPGGGDNYDGVAAAIFSVGEALNINKRLLWTLIGELPVREL